VQKRRANLNVTLRLDLNGLRTCQFPTIFHTTKDSVERSATRSACHGLLKESLEACCLLRRL